MNPDICVFIARLRNKRIAATARLDSGRIVVTAECFYSDICNALRGLNVAISCIGSGEIEGRRAIKYTVNPMS